jgi:Protein of unknown function (DUF1566)
MRTAADRPGTAAMARKAFPRRRLGLLPFLVIAGLEAACTPSAPPADSPGSASPRAGQAGGGATGSAGAGGSSGSGGASGSAGSSGTTGSPGSGGYGGSGGSRLDAPRPRDSARPADGPRRADVGLPASDTRPPAAIDSGPFRPDAPPANPGAGCAPGGAGLDTSTPGLVLDRQTCLVWQREDPERNVSACPLMIRDHPSKLCYDEAIKSCQALRLDGKSDWRLPTVAELQSLVVPASNPTIDRTAFPEAVLSLYWSSQAAAGKVTCVDFSNRGNVNPNIGPDGPQAFRCVRGPVAAP